MWDRSEGLSQFSGKIENHSKNKVCLNMCVKDMHGRVEALGAQVKIMTPGKFASISAPAMTLTLPSIIAGDNQVPRPRANGQ